MWTSTFPKLFFGEPWRIRPERSRFAHHKAPQTQGIAEEERRKLARELHDSLSPALVAMTMHLRAAEAQSSRHPAKSREHLALVTELVQECQADMRRIVRGLYTPDSSGIEHVPPQALGDSLLRESARLVGTNAIATVFRQYGQPVPLPERLVNALQSISKVPVPLVPCGVPGGTNAETTARHRLT